MFAFVNSPTDFILTFFSLMYMGAVLCLVLC